MCVFLFFYLSNSFQVISTELDAWPKKVIRVKMHLAAFSVIHWLMEEQDE